MFIDKLLLLTYLLVTLLVGLYYRSKSDSLVNFNKIGKSFSSNKFVLTATIFASSVGGGTIFGINAKVFEGVLGFSYGLILSIPIEILIAIYIVPKFSKFYGITSIGEVFEGFYGKPGRVISGFAAFMVSSGYLAVQISVSGTILSFLFEVNFLYAVIFSYIIVIIYTTYGGLKSIVANNSIQFLAIILATPIVFFCGLKNVGYEKFISHISDSKYIIWQNNDLLKHSIYAGLSFSIMGFHPTFLQRILVSKDSDIISKSVITKIWIFLIFIIFITLNGILSSIIVPDSNSNLSLIKMINEIVPPILKGIIFIGLMSAVMSTGDSDLNIASTSLSNDFVKILFNLEKQDVLLLVARIINAIIGVVAILLAINFAKIVDLVFFVAGFWAPMILPPLFGILFGYKISQKNFYISNIIGITTFFIWHFIKPEISITPVFLGTLMNGVFFILSKPTKEKEIF